MSRDIVIVMLLAAVASGICAGWAIGANEYPSAVAPSVILIVAMTIIINNIKGEDE